MFSNHLVMIRTKVSGGSGLLWYGGKEHTFVYCNCYFNVVASARPGSNHMVGLVLGVFNSQGQDWVQKSPSGFLKWINLPLLRESVVWRRDRRVHTAQLWNYSFIPPRSADEQRWMFHAPLLLPLFTLYRVQSRCALLPNSALLYFTPSFVLRPQSLHRKHIVVMPSGRLTVWCKLYIHPNPTTLSFSCVLTFSLASVCTLGCASLPHVLRTRDQTNG